MVKFSEKAKEQLKIYLGENHFLTNFEKVEESEKQKIKGKIQEYARKKGWKEFEHAIQVEEAYYIGYLGKSEGQFADHMMSYD